MGFPNLLQISNRELAILLLTPRATLHSATGIERSIWDYRKARGRSKTSIEARQNC